MVITKNLTEGSPVIIYKIKRSKNGAQTFSHAQSPKPNKNEQKLVFTKNDISLAVSKKVKKNHGRCFCKKVYIKGLNLRHLSHKHVLSVSSILLKSSF